MNHHRLMLQRSACCIGQKLRRYSLAIILVAVLVITLFYNIQINATGLNLITTVESLLPYRSELPTTEYDTAGPIGKGTTIENDIKSLADRQRHFTTKEGQITSRHEVTTKKELPDHVSEKLRNTNIYPTSGYKRAEFLRNTCAAMDHIQTHPTVRVSYDEKHKALYCPLCKLASTFWTRVFRMLDNNNKGHFTRHPFDVPISQAPASRLYYDVSSQRIGNRINAKESFKFMFVRNPYSMLFSAFVDKIVGPNPAFWNAFKTRNQGNITNTCGADVTFEQFLRHVVHTYTIKHTLDCHVATFDACQPCAMNYTFIARMETFKEDTFHILSKLNQTKTLEVFEKDFISLHADDAIDDSTSGPFSWKKYIRKCITWSEALQRIWRKLQIRGLIGGDKFPLNDNEVESVTKDEFVVLLKKMHLKSTSGERTWQKEQAFKEAYRSVPVDVLDAIRNIYSKEFLLFDYNDLPDEIFDRNKQIPHYRFLDYTSVKENIMQIHYILFVFFYISLVYIILQEV